MDVDLTASASERNLRPKNRPKDTKLRQQKLPAWQPILTAYTVIPSVFIVGITFLPIGIALYLASASVKEMVYDYTNCEKINDMCNITLIIKEDFVGDVYFYYGLENFYQNHRRYMKSRSDQQLLGNLNNTGECEPYAHLKVNGVEKIIAPCGAVANSMFNDTFILSKDGVQVPWTYKGVVWPVDKQRKFQNPPGETLQKAFANTVKPPNWKKEVWQLDPNNPDNNGFLNTDFIVWMRTAALPSFRKLYRILDRNTNNFNTNSFSTGLLHGTYMLSIHNTYPVSVFGGKKTFIISTTSWAGGKNPFLGIAYIVVGSLCLVLGFVFLFIHLRFGNSLDAISNLTHPPR